MTRYVVNDLLCGEPLGYVEAKSEADGFNQIRLYVARAQLERGIDVHGHLSDEDAISLKEMPRGANPSACETSYEMIVHPQDTRFGTPKPQADGYHRVEIRRAYNLARLGG